MQATLTKKNELQTTTTQKSVVSPNQHSNVLGVSQVGVPFYLQRSQDIQRVTSDVQTTDEDVQSEEPTPRLRNDIKLAPSRIPHPQQDIGTGYVASFYFYTHQAELGSADREMLQQIAKEYQFVISPQQQARSRTAQPNYAHIHGNADMRVARRPNNTILSRQRAETVRDVFLAELNSFREPGSESFDVQIYEDGVEDCRQDAACERGDTDAMALARRADLYIMAARPAPVRANESDKEQEILSEFPEEQRDKILEVIRELRRKDVTWEKIKMIARELAIEVLKQITLVDLALNLLEAAFAFLKALEGKEFRLMPIGAKGWAYGATQWAFGYPSIDDLFLLRDADANKLEQSLSSDWLPDAQNLWFKAVRDGYDHMQKSVYQDVFKDRTAVFETESGETVSLRELAQMLIRNEFNNDPQHMAIQLYQGAIAKATVFVGPANVEAISTTLTCDYPD